MSTATNDPTTIPRFDIAAERQLDDVREDWLDTVAALDRARFLRGRPLRRVHTGFSALGGYSGILM